MRAAMSGGARVISSDALFLGEGAVVERGAVAVDSSGAVLAAGPRSAVAVAYAGLPEERVRGVIVPGLVNAHTHVELSALRGRTTAGRGFVAWVDGMLAARTEVDEAEEVEGIVRGVAELVASGTVAVGEVTNTLAAVSTLRRANLAGYVFHEIFGLHEGTALARLDAMGHHAAALAFSDEDALRWSPSPHTLHTTHPNVVTAIATKARARRGRFSVHLAEHAGERAALERGTGPMVAWLEARTQTPREAFRWHAAGPVAVADTLGLLASDALLVHLTDARPEELELVARRGAHVVLCPRSNLFIETRLPPLLEMRRSGIAPALGTDSLASCPTLDVLAEAKALHERFAEVPAHEFLAMATINGARALDVHGALGSFEPGKTPGVLLLEGDIPAGLDPGVFALRQPMRSRRMLVAPAHKKVVP